MEENKYYRQDVFSFYLEEFVKSSPGVKAAALVAADGFALAAAGDASDIEGLDAFSTLTANVIKRARTNFDFEPNEVVIADPENTRVVCRHFAHEGETSGDYTLVLRCNADIGNAQISTLIAKLKEALETFY